MIFSSVNAGDRVPNRSACGDPFAFDASFLGVKLSDASLRGPLPEFSHHDGATLGRGGALTTGQRHDSAQNPKSQHIHPSDLFCPFNLSGAELQLWRQCRAADRGHQIASRGVSGVF